MRKVEASFLGIVLLSVLLRLFSAFYQGNAIDALPGVQDQMSYHTLATRVLEGRGFSFGTDWWPATRAGAPTAFWSYLYALYLAAVYFIFGANPLAARLIQALAAGILHPWVSWRIGRRIFGEQAGLVAAFFAGVYGYFVYYAGALMTESFYLLAILWALDIATRLASPDSAGNPGRRTDWILLGAAAGVAVLLRQTFLFMVPLLFGWLAFVLRKSERRGAGRGLTGGVLTAGVVIALMVAPWSLRNYLAFGRFVLLNTNAGFALFWGNHPIHGDNFIPILRDQDPSYGSLIPRELRRLDEASLDRELLRKGLAFVVQDPQRYFRLSLSRAKEYFKFWPSGESSRASNLIRVLSFGLFLPFMLLGLASILPACVSAWMKGRPALRRFPCNCHLLLLLFVVFYTMIHLLTWTLIRYRLPVDGVLTMYGAAGILWLAKRLPGVRTLFFDAPAR